MKTPTIYDIKYAVKGYFFSPQSMKVFGQTLKSFRVVKSPHGNIYIYAPMRSDGRMMGYTFRQFKNNELKIISPRCETLDEIKKYIQEN